jgi:predicted regulator of Ras-like GTPase activity (Roadblock/LC7/MglB family)
MVEEELDAGKIVRLISRLPGIRACMVMLNDGQELAGNFSEDEGAAGLSAMAPPFYRRVASFARELELGELKTCSIYTDERLISFFKSGDVCLTILHSGRGFLPGVREKLTVVTRELSRVYSI